MVEQACGHRSVLDPRLGVPGRVRQAGEFRVGAADVDVVPERLVNLHRSEPHRACRVVVAHPHAHHRGLVEDPRAQGGLDAVDARQRRLQLLARLDAVAADAPEVAHRRRQAKLARRVVGLAREVERSRDVRQFGLGAVEPGSAALPPARPVVLGERDAPGELPAAELLDALRRLDIRERVRADRLEQGETRLGAAGERRGDEPGVQERVEAGRDVRGRIRGRLERAERRAGGERREHCEHVRRRRAEQPHAPVDRRAQRALALGQVRGAPREEREGLPEP